MRLYRHKNACLCAMRAQPLHNILLEFIHHSCGCCNCRCRRCCHSTTMCPFLFLLLGTLKETMRGNWYPNTNPHMTTQWSPPSLMLRPARSEKPATCCRDFTTCLVASSVTAPDNSCTIFCSFRHPSAKKADLLPQRLHHQIVGAWFCLFCRQHLHITPCLNIWSLAARFPSSSRTTSTEARTCDPNIENRQMVHTTLDTRCEVRNFHHLGRHNPTSP